MDRVSTIEAERVLTRAFLLCAGANFLQGLAFNLFLHLPGFLHDLGAAELQIGFLFGLTAAVAIAARPLVGRAMDAQGRRAMILGGGVLNVAVCALYLTVHRLDGWVYLVRAAHGVAEAILFTGFFTQAADLVPAPRRMEGMAIFGVSGMLPISLGGLIGDQILAGGSYGQLFGCATALGFASLVLSLPLRDQPLPHGELPSRGFFAAVAQPDLRPVWFIGSIFATALAAYFTFIKTFVLHTGTGSVGAFFTAYAAAAIGLRVFFAWLPDRAGPKRVLFPALGALSAGLLLLAHVSRANEIVAAGALCGLGHGFIFPILTGLVVARARPAERGAALSIFTALFDAGVALGGPALGIAIHFGGYGTMFTAAAALVAIGSLIFAVWDRAEVSRIDR